GGKASHERVTEMICSACYSQRQGFMLHLVVPESFAVGMQQNMRMSFYKAGHQRSVSQVDQFRTRCIHARGGAGTLDALSFHAHAPAFAHALAVEGARGPQNISRACFAWRAGLGENRCRKYEREGAGIGKAHLHTAIIVASNLKVELRRKL